MMKRGSRRLIFATFAMWTAIAASAQTYTTLVDFDGSNGTNPYDSLAQGTDGSFYGTTYGGGAVNDGTAFKINSEGVLTTLYSFCTQTGCSDGFFPTAGLVLATDGNFYGTTGLTIFKITPDRVLTTLYTFCEQCNGGNASLIQASDGNFYGTTTGGGAYGDGTIYKMTPGGLLTTLHSFGFSDGQSPESGLIQSSNGQLFGTTLEGGTYGYGTIFKMTLAGVLTTIYNFCSRPNCIDGAYPRAALLQGGDGALYGTTANGGNIKTCYLGCGTIFRITPSGKLLTVHVFDFSDGSDPSGLIQATDGGFYGMTEEGGSGCGTVFKIDGDGTLTALHNFSDTEGCSPSGGLLQATGGKFYGTTRVGGSNTAGTVFSLDTGLGPFVTFVRPGGKAGQTAGILGQGFTGTTGVSFHGAAANFTVKSDTFLTATIPAGAATGYVTVTTPSGPVTSNVPFQVIP